MSSPARSWSRIATSVASSWASSRYLGSIRHSSFARTRGGKRSRSRARSISQSGCAYEPTRLVGSALGVAAGTTPKRYTAHRRLRGELSAPAEEELVAGDHDDEAECDGAHHGERPVGAAPDRGRPAGHDHLRLNRVGERRVVDAGSEGVVDLRGRVEHA